MADVQAAHADLRDRLVGAGRLLPTGVDGLYGRDRQFEAVVSGLRRELWRMAAPDEPTRVDYPPFIPSPHLDLIGYLHNFPQLCGVVYSFEGNERDHRTLIELLESGADISPKLDRAEVSLTPACCYPVYPSCTGPLPDEGRVFQLESYCFRHEPSIDPMRLQVFRQFENVRLGTPDQVVEWRSRWFERALPFLRSLGLDVITDAANDPFFGRAGRLMSVSQREQDLKTEFLVNVFGDEQRTACASINYHQEHFGHLFDIEAGGEVAHTSCIGFGLERCTVALFATHGVSIDEWPDDVRQRLVEDPVS